MENEEIKYYTNEDLIWMQKLAYYRPLVAKLLQERKTSIYDIMKAKIMPKITVGEAEDDWFNVEEDDVLPEKF